MKFDFLYELWGATDWFIVGLVFGLLGSFYLVKHSLFNPQANEETRTYYGCNPFARKALSFLKFENSFGFILLAVGFACQLIGVWWQYEGKDHNSIIFSNIITSFLILLLMIISIFGIFKLIKVLIRSKHRKLIANERMSLVDEHILTIQANYLRKDLREKSKEERERINNLQQCKDSSKEQIEKFIKSTGLLIDLKLKRGSDLERLEYLKDYFKKWLLNPGTQ